MMQIIPQDILLLKRLWQCSYLDKHYIEQYIYTHIQSKAYVAKRLRALQQYGYIEVLPITFTHPRTKTLYKQVFKIGVTGRHALFEQFNIVCKEQEIYDPMTIVERIDENYHLASILATEPSVMYLPQEKILYTTTQAEHSFLLKGQLLCAVRVKQEAIEVPGYISYHVERQPQAQYFDAFIKRLKKYQYVLQTIKEEQVLDKPVFIHRILYLVDDMHTLQHHRRIISQLPVSLPVYMVEKKAFEQHPMQSIYYTTEKDAVTLY